MRKKLNRIAMVVSLLVAAGAFIGCETNQATPADKADSGQGQEAKQNAKDDDSGDSDNGGLMDLANNLVKKAKEVGGDAINQASDKGVESVDWVNEMYQSLKDQGLTSARSATEWVQDDFRNMNAVEYKIIRTTITDVAEFEKQMNELGQDRWDCFHVQERDGTTTFFFKKAKRSYMRNIPLKDMIRLVPFMGGE